MKKGATTAGIALAIAFTSHAAGLEIAQMQNDPTLGESVRFVGTLVGTILLMPVEIEKPIRQCLFGGAGFLAGFTLGAVVLGSDFDQNTKTNEMQAPPAQIQTTTPPGP